MNKLGKKRITEIFGTLCLTMMITLNGCTSCGTKQMTINDPVEATTVETLAEETEGTEETEESEEAKEATEDMVESATNDISFDTKEHADSEESNEIPEQEEDLDVRNPEESKETSKGKEAEESEVPIKTEEPKVTQKTEEPKTAQEVVKETPVIEASQEKHTHSFEDVMTKEATCSTPAIWIKRCSTCGYTEGEEARGNALGHSYKEQILYEATCTNEGYVSVTCSRCGEIGPGDGPIPLRACEEVSEIVSYGNCKNPRHIRFTCKNCGMSRDEYDSSVDSDQHEWVEESGTVYDPITEEYVEVTRTVCRLCNREK